MHHEGRRTKGEALRLLNWGLGILLGRSASASCFLLPHEERRQQRLSPFPSSFDPSLSQVLGFDITCLPCFFISLSISFLFRWGLQSSISTISTIFPVSLFPSLSTCLLFLFENFIWWVQQAFGMILFLYKKFFFEEPISSIASLSSLCNRTLLSDLFALRYSTSASSIW